MENKNQYWAVVCGSITRIVQAENMTKAKLTAFGKVSDGMCAYPLGTTKAAAIEKFRTLDRSKSNK